MCGVSYEATAALFTVAKQHEAVKGCIALYPFWDAFQDVNMPGGIHHHKFLTGKLGMQPVDTAMCIVDGCMSWRPSLAGRMAKHEACPACRIPSDGI